jgi:RHS repeat-associated protein
MTDAESRQTSYGYDAEGRLAMVIDANGGVARTEYDGRGKPIRVTDPNGNETLYAYDAMGRLAGETDALGNMTSYTYDASGNLGTRTDANGQVTTYHYDTVNRLISRTFSLGGSVAYTYDDAGNRLSMADSAGTTAYQYDALNRVNRVADPFGKVVQYAYDAAGRRSLLTYPGNHQLSYGYDASGRLIQVQDWLGTITTFSYDNANHMTGQVNGNGTLVSRTFDAGGRLTSLTNTTATNATISSQQFTLDRVGNRTRSEETMPLAPDFTSQSLQFTHNLDNQLTADGIYNYTYDANGNCTSWSDDTTTVSYAYNAMDRLTRVDDGSIADVYVYNGDGDLIAAVRSGAETRYVIDLAAGMTTILAETDGTGTIQRYYIHAGGLLYAIDAGTNARHYYHYDAIGSTLALTSQAGAITDSYAYSPYGLSLGEEGSTGNRFRYVGQYGVMAEDSGLLFMRARFYDPWMKRFIGKDPMTPGIGDPVPFNRYPYAADNPIFFIDAEGQFIECIIAILGLGASIFIGYQWEHTIKPMIPEAVKKIQVPIYYTVLGIGPFGIGYKGTIEFEKILDIVAEAPTINSIANGQISPGFVLDRALEGDAGKYQYELQYEPQKIIKRQTSYAIWAPTKEGHQNDNKVWNTFEIQKILDDIKKNPLFIRGKI